jgi:hypothetical protein
MVRRTNLILGMYVRGTKLNISSIDAKGVISVISGAIIVLKNF